MDLPGDTARTLAIALFHQLARPALLAFALACFIFAVLIGSTS